MGPNLQHIANTSPITSLAFHTSPDVDPLLLAGEGPFVKVLEISGSPLAKSHRIFARERVHGIVISPTAPQVLFWGGRSISITSITSLLALQWPPLREVAVSDWVFYANFLPSTRGGIPRVAVITAHNSLLLFSPDSGWTELAAGERCMLYSAHLIHLPAEPDSESGQDERILVAAGTVFGEILVWSATLTNTDEKGKATLHYRLLGHEGSIFGVSISPVYPERKRYLASCSDDRTVRVWDISHLPSSAPSSEETRDGQSKNTGFSHTPEATPGGACLSLGWGHTARIWGVRFLPELTANGEIRLLSISEDLTSKFWSFNPEITAMPQFSEKASTELRNTASHQLHSGKHVWSYALHVGAGLLATGGADGRVGLVKYDDPEDGLGEEEWDMMAVLLSALGEEDTAGSKDAFKAYAVLDSDRFLVTTSQGRLLTYSLSTKNWKLVAAVDSLKSWSVLASWQDEGMVALGNGTGQVGVCRVDTGREWWWNVGGESVEVGKRDKVGGVWTSAGVKRGDTPETKTYHILTTSLVTSILTLHAFTRSDDNLENRTTTILTPPSENGTKKFLVTSMCIDYTTSLLFLGSRYGAIAIYELSGALRGCWHGLHDTDAVTSITALSTGTEVRVLTAGRNGGYAILSFSSGPKPAMTILHAVKPTACTVIEGATRARVLHGFRGKHFFVWDEQQACEVAAVECGGAHRAWGFYWPDDTQQEKQQGWLVWTKASKVRVARIPLARRRILQQGLHGREIKAVAYSAEMAVLATGAEDTVVRLSTVSGDTGEVVAVVAVKRHTTGVQHLVWSPCGRWLFSSGGVEEFFVWRVRRLEGGLGVVEEAKCEIGEEGGDLRICGFDVVGVHEEKTGEVVGFVVGMVYSDSSIKIYNYNLATKTFILLIVGTYKTCCLLHAHFVVLPPTAPSLPARLLLLVAATDGFITAYDLTDLLSDHQLCATPEGNLIPTTLTPSQKKKNKKKKQRKAGGDGARALPPPALTTRVHQSSIKSLAVTITPSLILVFTGGDDCALAVTRVPFALELGPVRSFVLPRAHASAVAAVVTLQGGCVLSVGVDQTVRLWEVVAEGEEVVVSSCGEAYTPVPDVAGAVVVGEGCVLLGGVGVDVWRVV